MVEPAKTRPACLMTGNEAIAEAALDAGMRFFAGYPITPSTEIAEALANKLPRVGGVFIQMEDEIAAASAIIGGSLTGAKVMTATSGPGFSLKQEALGYACEAEIPSVWVNVQRGGPSTGLPTLPAQGDVMQARWGTHGDHSIVVLYPSSVQETYTLTVKAFNIAEALRTPVILLMDEVIAHVTEKVRLPLLEDLEIIERKKTDKSPADYLPYEYTDDLVPPLVPFGTGYRFHVTGLLHQESGFPSNDPAVAQKLLIRLHNKIETAHRDLIDDWGEEHTEDAEVLLYAYGAVARTARSAVKRARSEGKRWGLFRPKSIWPFLDAPIATLSERVNRIVVAEMNMGQLVGEVRRAVAGRCQVDLYSKVGGDPIHPDELYDFVAGGA
ncbi:MAG: 2-oxoacid:acceptor oxidoreductase subunit alpha [Pseudomonadota bacterium]